jgi:hypothetical protein
VINTWFENISAATLASRGELAAAGCSGPYDTFRGQHGSWSAWMMCNLYEQYRFDPDPALLQEKLWPLLKGNSKFFLNRMTAGLNGRKNMLDDDSPENIYLCDPVTDQFLYDSLHQRIYFHDTSAAFTQQCAVNILTHTVEAATILNIEPALRDSCKNLLAAMDSGLWVSPTDGRLQEFWHDNLVGQRHHRHCSHLLCVWPFEQVSPLVNPAYAAAAKKSVMQRGINFGPGKYGTWTFNPIGFGEAIRAGVWARLGDGDSAYYAYHATLAGWVAPNFWPGAYYPGEVPLLECLGGAAAVVPEMLVQSHIDNKIQLLPALSSKWPKGSVQGLRCRNGFTITSMSWDNSQLVGAYIKSERGKTCKIYGINYTVKDEAGVADIPVSVSEGCLVFNTTAGTTYKIVPGSTGLRDRRINIPKSRLEIKENQLWFSTQRAHEYTITIDDLQGKTIPQRTVKGPVTTAIRLNLPSGFYMASAHSATEQIKRKILLIGNSAF